MTMDVKLQIVLKLQLHLNLFLQFQALQQQLMVEMMELLQRYQAEAHLLILMIGVMVEQTKQKLDFLMESILLQLLMKLLYIHY